MTTTPKDTEVAIPVQLDIDVIGNDVRITKDDVVSITLDKAERKCKKELSRLSTESTQIQEARDAANKALAELCVTDANELLTEHLEVLIAPLSYLHGVKLKHTITVSGIRPFNEKERASAGKKGYLGNYSASVSIATHNDSHCVFNVAKQMSLPASAKPIVKQLDELVVKYHANSADQLAWRTRLQNLPTLERQYKAKLAEIKLSRTAEGQKILDRLNETLDDDVMNLKL